jgi:hypothetical protein
LLEPNTGAPENKKAVPLAGSGTAGKTESSRCKNDTAPQKEEKEAGV